MTSTSLLRTDPETIWGDQHCPLEGDANPLAELVVDSATVASVRSAAADARILPTDPGSVDWGTGPEGKHPGQDRDSQRSEWDELSDEWELLRRQWAVVRRERDALKRSRKTLTRMRNTLKQQRETAEDERDTLEYERDLLKHERELLAVRCSVQQKALVFWERAWTLRRLRRCLEAYARAVVSHARCLMGAADAGFRGRLASLAGAAFRRLPLPDGARWRLASALFGLCGPALRGTQAWHSYQQQRRWREKVHRLKHEANSRRVGPVPPRSRTAGKADLVFWSIIDWEFRHQRPQHLAAGFANRGHRVFYISVRLVENAEPGFLVEPIDEDAGIYSINLYSSSPLEIYGNVPKGASLAFLKRSLGAMLAWAETDDVISIVQYPFWYQLAQSIPGGRVCFDCMDHLAGFSNVPPAVVAEEARLLRGADTVVVSAVRLHELTQPLRQSKALTMVRNACEYDHFAREPQQPYRDPGGRRVIGYYGAIAEWFDIDLVRKIAHRFPDCAVLLVGRDTVGAQARLADCANVDFVGEVPYEALPKYLYGMDVCTIPFQLNDLTRATNPVKAYEYLCSGRPVVSVALPELGSFEGQVLQARSHEQFLTHLDRCLSESPGGSASAKRKAFAARHTWSDRVEAFAEALEAMPRATVSVVIVTYNNLDLTKTCLASLQADPLGPPYEVIVVDNASTDGTPDYLAELSQSLPWMKVLLNSENRGFAAANNQGLAIANGDFLVLLNNDTVVTPGWAQTLAHHLRSDPQIGAIGPVTNNIGNEARMAMRYQKLEDMPAEARANTCARLGQTFDIRVLAFFCVMFPRATYEAAGPLDENFGRGFFEDDDYCQRIRRLGKRLVCAEDVFVHHHLSAAFGKLTSSSRQKLFEQNRAYYESKWGPWMPHSYRQDVMRESVVPAATSRSAADEEILTYRCNICRQECRAPISGLGREVPSCSRCGSTVRMRAVIHLLTSELFGESCSLPELPVDKSKRGLGLSDWPGYARRLARRLDYTNTFLEKRPRLNILWPPERLLGTADFLISSDVFDHVAPPVQAAFDSACRLLKPGGVLILTVPYHNNEQTTEHFPDLSELQVHDWMANPLLIDWSHDGWQKVLDGELRSMDKKRIFCKRDLLDRLQRAGFVDVRVLGDDYRPFGIVWPESWSLPIVARRAA